MRFVRAVVGFSRKVAIARGTAAIALSLFSVIMAVLALIFIQRRLITLLFKRLKNRIARKYGKEVAARLITRLTAHLAKRAGKKIAIGPLKRFRKKVATGVAGGEFLAERAVKKITTGPLKRFVRKKFATAVAGESLESLTNILIFVSREFVYEQIGHNRVGHHTLLAKDHGREMLYLPMKDCARFIHWHVMRTMLRHAEPASRAQFVDWLALLERYLRHSAATEPAAQSVPSTFPAAVSHVAQAGDTLVSLARSYGRTAVDPVLCTWEALADANFDTADLTPEQRVDVLRQELGSGPEEGFRLRPGRILLIPNQRFPIGTAAAAEGAQEVPWFETVMRESWRAFVPAGDEAVSTERPSLPDPPLVSEERLRDRIREARRLRATLEKAYSVPDR